MEDIDFNVDTEEVEVKDETPSDNEADVTAFDTSLINNDMLKSDK